MLLLFLIITNCYIYQYDQIPLDLLLNQIFCIIISYIVFLQLLVQNGEGNGRRVFDVNLIIAVMEGSKVLIFEGDEVYKDR